MIKNSLRKFVVLSVKKETRPFCGLGLRFVGYDYEKGFMTSFFVPLCKVLVCQNMDDFGFCYVKVNIFGFIKSVSVSVDSLRSVFKGTGIQSILGGIL